MHEFRKKADIENIISTENAYNISVFSRKMQSVLIRCFMWIAKAANR